MGHLTHHRALAAQVERDRTVRATWMPVHYRSEDLWQRMPGVRSNVSLLLSLRARRTISARQRETGSFDALFFHTQLTSLLSHRAMAATPSIISLDATPLNADPQPPAIESRFVRRPDGEGPWDRFKFEWYRRAFSRAAGIVAWSEWARRSLLADYQIEPSKVSVIPPGVDVDFWQPRAQRAEREKPRILFVGVDFRRKGGELLLRAFERFTGRAELDIVSPEAPLLPRLEGVRTHADLSINSEALRQLYARADVFVLPTLNDCTPIAVLEAMASGLPVIASDVGAVREQVEHGVTGLLTPAAEPGALSDAIESLLCDAGRRRAMGAAGRARAERLFCAARNYAQVLSLIKRCVESWTPLAGTVGDEELSPRGAERRNGVIAAGERAWASEL